MKVSFDHQEVKKGIFRTVKHQVTVTIETTPEERQAISQYRLDFVALQNEEDGRITSINDVLRKGSYSFAVETPRAAEMVQADWTAKIKQFKAEVDTCISARPTNTTLEL
jgi:hypothetical protein